MANTRPSSAPLFTTWTDLYAELTEDVDTDPILQGRGCNQFLGRSANQHDDQPTTGPRANKVQAGQLPKTKSGPVGRPNRANPLGSETSLNG